jgi:hypothetical protein
MEFYKKLNPDGLYSYIKVDSGKVTSYDKNMKTLTSSAYYLWKNTITRYTLIDDDMELSKLLLIQKN